MELRQLKTFLTVGRVLSFHRAAEILHYAQSTVSMQIRTLEDEFGVPLFDRLGEKVHLTEAGEALMRYAQKMQDIEAKTISAISGGGQTQGSVSLRLPQSLDSSFLPRILGKFKPDFPKVSLNIHHCTSVSLEQELKAGITDLGFLLIDSITVQDLNAEFLGSATLILAVGAKHPLSGKKRMTLKDLEGETMLIPNFDCSYRNGFEKLLSEEEVTPGSVVEMNTMEAIRQCAAQGLGLALLPRFLVREELEQQTLRALPWPEEPLETAVLMIWHKDKWISPTLSAFMAVVREIVPPGLQ